MPDGVVDDLDYGFWKAHFGEMAPPGSGAVAGAAVPEPATALLLMLAAAGAALRHADRVNYKGHGVGLRGCQNGMYHIALQENATLPTVGR